VLKLVAIVLKVTLPSAIIVYPGIILIMKTNVKSVTLLVVLVMNLVQNTVEIVNLVISQSVVENRTKVDVKLVIVLDAKFITPIQVFLVNAELVKMVMN